MTTVGAAFAQAAGIEIVQAAVDAMKVHESEKTRREYIRANRDVLVTALNNERDCLLAYFEMRFAERRGALEQFYSVLQAAVDNGDTTQLQAAVAGILGIIKENPLGDLAEFREKWSNPEFVIEL